MPLAAVINPSPVPGTAALRTDSAGAPDRSGAAAAFDALLGDAVSADARAAGGGRLIKDVAAPGGKVSQGQSGPLTAQQDVRFDASLPDQEIIPEEATMPEGVPVNREGGAEQTSTQLKEPEPGVKAGTDAGMATGWLPDNVQTGAAAGPAQPAIATGEVAQIDAGRAPGVRDPGVRDSVQKPVGAPELAAMPDADPAAGADGADPLASDGGDTLAPRAYAAPALSTDGALPPSQMADSTPRPDGDPEIMAGSGTDPAAAPQPAMPAQSPAPDVVANAASVRREGEPRRVAQGGDSGKAGDEPAKSAQSGTKAQDPATAPSVTPAKSGAPDLPLQQRSADAFQALLQAQTRPSAEAAAPRASDLSLDPSGDTGLRSSPDRAAELQRTSGPTPPGAAPRFVPQTVQTLAAQIVRRQSEGGRVFDIRLDPPELGRVGVRLEMGKDQMVKAMLSAERPDTLQELQRTARDLERALADAGLNLAENGLSFSLGGERGERDNSGSDAPRGARSVVEIDVARPGAPEAALYGFALARAAGLDIQA